MATIIGTLGNDTLIDLNSADDEIFGDSTGVVNVAVGSDRIFGRGGDDIISGDAQTIGPLGTGGNDLIQGGDGIDQVWGDAIGPLFGVGGNDTIYQNGGGVGLLVGDAEVGEAGARGGNDKLFGSGTLVGDCEFGMTSATGGNDLLDASGATQGSLLFGDMSLGSLDGTGVGGRDILKGSAFDDVLVGDGASVADAATAGDDRLRGNGGDDELFGDGELVNSAVGGDDELRGGAGGDLIFGDGNNLFDFAAGGDDRISAAAVTTRSGATASCRTTPRVARTGFASPAPSATIPFSTSARARTRSSSRASMRASPRSPSTPGDTVLTSLGDDTVRLSDFTDPLTFGIDVIFA